MKKKKVNHETNPLYLRDQLVRWMGIQRGQWGTTGGMGAFVPQYFFANDKCVKI